MDNDLKIALGISIVALASVLLDLSVLRQTIGFIFLSFVPGFLVLKILRISKRDSVTTILMSFGLSITLLSLLGLCVNGFGLALDFLHPLSFYPMVVTVFGSTLFLLLFCVGQRDVKAYSSVLRNVSLGRVLKLSPIVGLAVLAAFGAVYHIVPLLLIAIVGIAVSLAVIVLFGQRFSGQELLVIILLFSIALLLHTVLVSKYFVGSDIFLEFHVFKLTDINNAWSPGIITSYSLVDSLNSLVSITILPKVYTTILGVSGETFFKLFYPTVFAFVPSVIYKICEQQTEKIKALLASFVFVSTSIVFYSFEPVSLSRQMVGMLFFLLSMFLILDQTFPVKERRLLTVVFAFSLIIAHYSLAYIFFLFILILFMEPRIVSFLTRRKLQTSQVLTLGMVVLIAAMIFSWYVYVANSPFNQLLNSIYRITDMFSADFLRLESRTSQDQLYSLSPTASSSLVGNIHKTLVYVELIFIGIGLLFSIVKRKSSIISHEFLVTAATGISILGMCFLVPHLSDTLNLSRFYCITLPFLAIFYVIGFESVFGLMGALAKNTPRLNLTAHGKHSKSIDRLAVCFATSVLICLFLFQVGFINHITQDYPYSYSLDLERKSNSKDLTVQVILHKQYFLDEEVLSSKWLAKKADVTAKVYADANSAVTVLRSYALLSGERLLPFTNSSIHPLSFIYLKYVNVRLNVLDSHNTTDLSSILDGSSKVYSNGCSDIYLTPPER